MVGSNEDKFWIHTDFINKNKRHKKMCADGKIGPADGTIELRHTAKRMCLLHTKQSNNTQCSLNTWKRNI